MSQSQKMGWLAFLSFFLSWAGFWAGKEYEHVISDAVLQKEIVKWSRQRFYDWTRFGAHLREDRKAFGESSLLFSSNIRLASLDRLGKSGDASLVVLQSPIDWQPYLGDVSVKKTLTMPGSTDAGAIKLVTLGKSSSGYRLRMSLGNQGKSVKIIGPKAIALKDDNGIFYYPLLRRSSVFGFSLNPGVQATYELTFQLPEKRLPIKTIVTDDMKSIEVPVEIIQYVRK